MDSVHSGPLGCLFQIIWKYSRFTFQWYIYHKKKQLLMMPYIPCESTQNLLSNDTHIIYFQKRQCWWCHHVIYTMWKYSTFTSNWYPYHIWPKKAIVCISSSHSCHIPCHIPCHIVQTMPNDSNLVYMLAWLHYCHMFAWFLFIPLESTGNECHLFQSDTGHPVHSGLEKLWLEKDLSGTPCQKCPLDSTGFLQIPKIPVGSDQKP